MKTKIISALFFINLTAVLLTAASCKKKKAFKNEDGQVSVDVRWVRGENDAALKDINEAFVSAWQERGQSVPTADLTVIFGAICGLSIDTTDQARGSIILNYDGSACDGKKRDGRIMLTLQDYPSVNLRSTNAVIKVDFSNYTIIKADGSSLRFNGTAYLKNESGESWFELRFLNLPALVQSFTADNLEITFNNNNTLLYNISRRSTYTYKDNVLKCAVEGTGSHDNKNNVEYFGATRDKNKFTSEIVSAVVWRSDCGPLKPVDGEVNIKENDKAFELKCTYGLSDANNHAVSDCPNGWKITYTYKSKTKTRFFNYIDS